MKIISFTTDGDVAVKGSQLQAENIRLAAAKNLELSSVQDIQQHRSRNQHSGWSLGAFVGANGGITGSASYGKGKENSDSLTQRHTELHGKQIEIVSGNDTALKGAVVNADQLHAQIGSNFTIESRQDRNRYNSKQVQGGVQATFTHGSGVSGGINGSLNNAKLNYSQVEQQSGIRVGTGGMDIHVAGHTHLKGGVIDAQGDDAQNRFTTGTFSTENIENRSEVHTQSVSMGIATDLAQTQAGLAGSLASALGNKNDSQTTETQSAVGKNIIFTATSQDEKTQQNLTALSRDTANANQKVQAYDLTEIREQQEAAKVIGEIAQNALLLTLKPKLDAAEAVLKDDNATAEQKAIAQQTINQYGTGSDLQMAARAVTGVLQGLAAKSTAAAVVGGLSPYANLAIKQATTNENGEVNKTAQNGIQKCGYFPDVFKTFQKLTALSADLTDKKTALYRRFYF